MKVRNLAQALTEGDPFFSESHPLRGLEVIRSQGAYPVIVVIPLLIQNFPIILRHFRSPSIDPSQLLVEVIFEVKKKLPQERMALSDRLVGKIGVRFSSFFAHQG